MRRTSYIVLHILLIVLLVGCSVMMVVHFRYYKPQTVVYVEKEAVSHHASHSMAEVVIAVALGTKLASWLITFVILFSRRGRASFFQQLIKRSPRFRKCLEETTNLLKKFKEFGRYTG